MIKILMPVEISYPSQAGGVANIVHYVIKHLDPDRFEPVIVATDKGLQANILRNQWRSTGGAKTRFVTTRSLTFPLRAIVNSLINLRKADIVHVSSVFFPTGLVTILMGSLFGKKIVVSPHGELDPWALKKSTRRKLPVIWIFRRFIARNCVFHSTCDHETEFIQRQFEYPVRVVQIPNFIDPADEVKRDPQSYLLFVGRITAIKALDQLIDALSISEKFLGADLILKIAGRGEKLYVEHLKQLAEKHGLSNKVEFVGQVEGDEKEKLFANAYWTILPSHAENFGMVVLESLAQNTPVIAAKGTPWKMLENEKVGFWAGNSPVSLAQTIDKIIAMPTEEYEGYRKRGRAFVEEHFDIEKNIGRWNDFYASLARK